MCASPPIWSMSAGYLTRRAADNKEAGDKGSRRLLPSTLIVSRIGGLAASPGSYRTIAFRGQKPEVMGG
jgi:hypothetical protein